MTPQMSGTDDTEYEVYAIRGRREVKVDGKTTLQYLVEFVGERPSANEWLPYDVLTCQESVDMYNNGEAVAPQFAGAWKRTRSIYVYT